MSADWSVLERDGVMDVAERAALRVTNEWAPSFAYEDLLQEALIFLSTKRDLREGLDEGGLGVLHHRLWSDLTDYARKENRRLHLNLSYDELVEAVDE